MTHDKPDDPVKPESILNMNLNKAAEKLEEAINIGFNNGDLHDEDSGDHLATIDVQGLTDKVPTPPAVMSLYIEGYWYVYAIKGRYKEGDNTDEKG